MDEDEVKKVEQSEAVNTDTVSSEEKKLNVCGLLSFIFSLVGLFLYGLPLGIAAIVLGIIGIAKFDKEKQKHKWMAIVGLCIGIFDILGVVLLASMIAALL